jgi:hypothetical protein
VEGVADGETSIGEGSVTGGKGDGVSVRVGVLVGVKVEVGVEVGVADCVKVEGGVAVCIEGGVFVKVSVAGAVGDCACATTAVAVNGSADGLHAAIIKPRIPRM